MSVQLAYNLQIEFKMYFLSIFLFNKQKILKMTRHFNFFVFYMLKKKKNTEDKNQKIVTYNFNIVTMIMDLLSLFNGPANQGSIPGRVIPKTQKMVLGATLFNTQHYKVRIKGKVEQSR